MLDLTNYNVKRPITKAEYDERVKRGLIKYGESVSVLNECGYPPVSEYVIIFPPGWLDTIEELKKDNWQDKHRLKVIYKYHNGLWEYMKEKNITPVEIINEIENETEYIEFWKE